MKNKIFSLCAALVVLLTAATSCDDWSPADKKFAANTGGVSLSDLDVNVDEKTNKPQGRASVDVSGFLVTIIDKTTNATAIYDNKECAWTYGEMPEVMTLPVGDYIVEVESHKPAKAEFAKPYFAGSKEFTVEDGKITSIGTVTCTFGSVKVSVRFSDSLKAAMGPDAQAKVVAGEAGAELVWTAAETRDGYFEAVEGSTTLVATFSGSVNGTQIKVAPKEFTDVKKGNYYIITFKLKGGTGMPDETGTIDPSGITVDSTIEEGDVDGDVPGGEDPDNPNGRPDDEEWPDEPTPPGPGPDEPGPDTPTNPIVVESTGDGINPDLNVVNDAVDGRAYSIKIKSENPMTHLHVEIISDYLTEEFLKSVGLTTKFDLAEPGDLGETLGDPEGFNFPVGDKVVGQTEVDFNLTPFIPLLNLSQATMLHTFKLTIEDNQGNSKTIELKFLSHE